MRLPVKLLPKQSQHVGNAVGAGIIVIIGLVFLAGYLPDQPPEKGMSFGEWIGVTGIRLPFLLITVLVLLFGLAALTIALINLFSGSPYNHLIVDRFGIRIRRTFGETHFSWKELGPIRPLRLSPLRAYGLDRRFWIVSDTFSGEARIDTRRPLSTFNMKIPVAAYLGSSWLGGNIAPAMEASAAWLESLRKLAHEEALNPDDVPNAPDELGPGLPVAKPAAEATTAKAPDLPAMSDRKFGRRDGPTVER